MGVFTLADLDVFSIGDVDFGGINGNAPFWRRNGTADLAVLIACGDKRITIQAACCTTNLLHHL